MSMAPCMQPLEQPLNDYGRSLLWVRGAIDHSPLTLRAFLLGRAAIHRVLLYTGYSLFV
jgi:hypothetical protein